MSSVVLPPLQLPDPNRLPPADRDPRQELSAGISPNSPSPQDSRIDDSKVPRPSDNNGTAASTKSLSENGDQPAHHKSPTNSLGERPSGQSLPSLSEALRVEAPISAYKPVNVGPPPPPPLSSRSLPHSSINPSPTEIDPAASQRYAYDRRDFRFESPRQQPPPYPRGASPDHRRAEPYPPVHGNSLHHPPQAPPAPPLPPASLHRSYDGSAYQPSALHNQQHAYSSNAPYDARRDDDRRAPRDVPPYGESVKRHLGIYDLEHALSDIIDHTNIISNFGQVYGARLHQSQRTGLSSGMLPAITEVDDLVNRAKQTLFALTKAREILVAQHAMQAQEVQRDERMPDYHAAARSDSMHYGEDHKPDAKKRKGRSAAPGRCHSCNRADTPEWRRGPDGARTLCNACGLHYAKLTRKQQNAKHASANSNLHNSENMSNT